MTFDWKKTLAAVAPALATALGGPLAGVATKAISDAVLGRPDGDEAEIAAAIQTGGADLLLKLKEADQSFAVEMGKLGIDLEKVHAGDRDSARRRQIELKDKTPPIMAYLITVGFFGVLAYMLVKGVPEQGGEALFVMLGSLGTAWIQCVTYYFGSSAGSAEKNRLLDRATQKA